MTMTYKNRFFRRIQIIMLAAMLTANTAGPVMAAPADEAVQSASGTEADESVQSSSGTEADESVESSSAEQQYDYEAAIAELEDLENQLDKAREDKEAVLEKVRSLDTKKRQAARCAE
jgi:TolA-binding protein